MAVMGMEGTGSRDILYRWYRLFGAQPGGIYRAVGGQSTTGAIDQTIEVIEAI